MQFSAISLYLAQSLTYKKICTKDIKLNSFYVGQASVEIKNNQMSTGEGYLFRACSSKGVNHNHLHFDRISKADRGMGQLYGGKEGRLQVCPNWRLLAWRSCRQAVGASSVFGQEYIFSFLWLVLKWKQDKYQESNQLLVKSWPLGANCYWGSCLSIQIIFQRLWCDFL